MPHLNIAPPNMGIIYKSHQSIPVFKIHEAWSTFWRSRRHATSSRVRQGPSDGAASSHGSCSHQNPPKGCWIWLVYPAYFNQLVAIVVANRYIPIISINNENFCWASIIQSLKCWGHNNLLGFALISGINSRVTRQMLNSQNWLAARGVLLKIRTKWNAPSIILPKKRMERDERYNQHYQIILGRIP